MNSESQPALFDATVRVDQIPAAGRNVTVNADAVELERLTELMHVSAVSAFHADLKAEKLRGGIHVTGELTAEVTQPCVVTFEPVVQKIAESVDRVFMPGEDRAFDASPGSETFVDLESDEIPDHFQGPELDLSPLLLEILGLSIDLYPRAPGAELPASDDGDSDEKLNPFAALKSLKQDGKGSQ